MQHKNNIKQYKIIKNQNKLPKLKIEKEITYNTDIFLSTEEIVNFMNRIYDMKNLFVEYVYLLSFNSQQKLLGVFELSHGSSTNSEIPIRELFISLLLSGAEQFTIVHNHPNGSFKASMSDINLSAKIKLGANQLDILFDDHIIIVDDGYLSMSYEKLI